MANADCVKDSKRTNPCKNKHALLLQLSFISPLTYTMCQTTAGQWDGHKKTYQFYGFISHLVRGAHSKVRSGPHRKTRSSTLCSHRLAPTVQSHFCFKLFLFSYFTPSHPLVQSRCPRGNPGRNLCLLPKSKKEILKEKLAAYHKSLIRAPVS